MVNIDSDREMRRQVTEALAGHAGQYDVAEIVSDLQARYGIIDINTIPHDVFWPVVGNHVLSPS